MITSPEQRMSSILDDDKPDVVQLYTPVIQSHPGLMEQVRRLTPVEPWRSSLDIAFDWMVIVGCVAAYIAFPSILVWLPAALIIGARQHALLVLAHDGLHYRLARSRAVNDRICNWLLLYPVFASLSSLRREHLLHHFHLLTEKDVELLRREGQPGWNFPTTKLKLAGFVMLDLVGLRAIPAIKFVLGIKPQGYSKIAADAPKKESVSQRAERVLFVILLIGGITYYQLWIPFLLLWVVPLLTVQPAVFRIRAIGRHYGLPHEHDLNMTRTVVRPTLLERFLIAPHHVNYHLDHHLFPSVPYYRYPQLHRALMTLPEYRDHAHLTQTYLGLFGSSVLNEVTARSDATTTAANNNHAQVSQQDEVVHAS